jgi:Class III cytochrome C family
MIAPIAVIHPARFRAYVMLAIALAPCARVAFAQRTPAPTTTTTQPTRDPGYIGPLEFSHRTHRALDCSTCHTSAERHGGLKVTTVAACQACHHAPSRQASCGKCHSASETEAARTVTLAMRLPIWAGSRERKVAFEHARHASLTCVTCHTTPVTLAPTRGCETCHDKHHTPEVVCRSCHAPPDSAAHARAAHLGCAGSGCHSAAGTASLLPMRNVCLACHQDKENHKPGQDCAKCHQVDWKPNVANPTRPGGS